jgi:predicted transglutaminase-like cysteine proteinase
MQRHLISAAILALAAFGASAQTSTAGAVQRDVNQQTRIEQGLKDGSLTTGEAARLEKEQSRVDRLQSRDLADGKLTPAERTQLKAAQDKASRDIAAAKHNDVKGNPQSASSRRMQADVQRNVNQERRIEAGVSNGSLTNREVGKLEGGQAKVDRKEYAAGRDGHVSAAEQQRVQRAENKQSRRIHRQKHDAQVRSPA